MERKRVLVVDDEEKIRQLLRRCLEPEYDVLLAQDGEEGLALARASRPDAILLDLRMPRLDGLNVLRCLKASVETLEIPVVVVSASGSSNTLMEADALGAVDYLIKPFLMSEVRQTVARHLEGRWG